MLNGVKEKIFLLKDELDYRIKLRQHQSKLPVLIGHDRLIANSLQNEGICITTLEKLGLPSTSELLNIAGSYLPSMGRTNYNSSEQNPPEIYKVTHLNDFFNWGNESKLLNILENYIGLPVAYHGVQIRKDFINQSQFSTML